MASQRTDIEEIWEEAFSLYQDETHRDLKSDPVILDLHSTDDLLAQITSHEGDFDSFRQKKAKLWIILRRAMHGVEVIGKFTENTLTLTPFSYASPVLGAVLYLVLAAKGVSRVYDSISELLSQLGNFTGRLEEYAKIALDPKLRRKIVEILTVLLEVFARSERAIKKGRLPQYLSVTFLSGNEKVARALDRLRALIDTETRLVGALSYSATVKAGEAVDRNERALQRTGTATERTEKKLDGIVTSTNESRRETLEKEERERLGRVLDEKTRIKVLEKHDDITDRRLSGTGDWIKSEPLYQQWIREERPILWILGGPGAGKSFLSSRIVSHLEEIYPQDPHRSSRISIAYFYIKEDDHQLRNANTILKVIALQLTAQDSVFRNFAAEACKSPENVATARWTWKKIFMDFFRTRQSRGSAAFVLMDGLDELPKKEQEILFQLLSSLGVADAPRLHFAMVGRPELRGRIISTRDAPTIFIEVSASKTSTDIENYIHKRVDRVRALSNRHIAHHDRKNLRDNIIKKLLDGANGMFLWVNLMLDQIYDRSRPSDIMSALDAAPQDLVKMIRHVFERIAADPSVNKEDLNGILTWVTCAGQRLTLGEMDNILKMRPPVGEGMPDLEDRLRGQFASFFTLSRKDNLTTEQLLQEEEHDASVKSSALSDSESEDDDLPQAYDSPLDTTYLEFSHSSVRDFLLKEGNPESRQWPADLGIGVDVSTAEFHITKTLLGVLCSADYDNKCPTNNLSSYAANFCLHHLLCIDKSVLTKMERQDIIHPLLTLFHDETCLERWLLHVSNPYEKWIRHWLKDGSLTDRIRDWFADKSIDHNEFTEEERLQMKGAAASTSTLFKPMAKFLRRQWVGPDENNWEPEFCVWLLYVYHSLVDCSSEVPKEGISLERLVLNEFPLACLRHLAEFGDVPKSSVWYRRFATVIAEAGYVNAAMKELDISLSLNPQDPRTMKEIATCFELRQDYFQSIEWERKALFAWSKDRSEEKAWSLQAIAMREAKSGQYKTAIEGLRKALELLPGHPPILFDYLDLLNHESRLEEIMTLATALEGDPSNLKEEDTLCILLKDSKTRGVLSRAAGALGETDLIERNLKKSLTLAETHETDQVSEMAYNLTKFRWRYNSRDSQVIQLWEDMLEKVQSRKFDSAYAYVLKRTANVLGQLYYDEASAAESRGDDPSAWILKLDNIVNPSRASDITGLNARQTNVLHMGVWHRLHGRPEEAKACFRRRVLEAIDILTDDDPDNDTYGFEILAQVLHKAGDDEGKETAISVPMALLNKLKAAAKEHTPKDLELREARTIDESRSDQEENTETEITDIKGHSTRANPSRDDSDAAETHTPIDNFSALDLNAQETPPAVDTNQFTWRCDGECARRVEDWQAIYACDVCLELCFCEQCVKLVKCDELGFRLCNPKHTFWQVYPCREELLDVATEVKEGKRVPRGEWLEGLRRVWAIE